jgi:hypothetical protein
MAKTSNRPNLIALALVVVVALIIGYLWLHKRGEPPAATTTAAQKPTVDTTNALAVPSDKIDPANEGRQISLSGDLGVNTPATDSQLGITAEAVMLLRYAEMLQWREQCTGGKNCTYQQVWSPQLISSAKFREPDGHKNPDRLPLTTARFSSSDVRLGAFKVDAAVLGNYRLDESLKIKPLPFKVSSAQLPSNLATTFRDYNGALYAGDPEHRKVGDVRVSYRIIPAAKVDLVGIQRGERLIVQKSGASAAPTAPSGGT